MVTFVILILLSTANAQQYKESGFKKISVNCFDTLGTSYNLKTLIECCGFCMAMPTCEGVRFDGTNCQTLTNLTTCCPTNDNVKKAWVETKIVEKIQANNSSEF